MTGEFDIGGVFFPPLLIWAIVAIIPYRLLRWALSRSGAYRFIWHRALFDIALYVLLVAGIDLLFSHPLIQAYL